MSLQLLLRRLTEGLEPDLYIGGKDNPYLLRWWLLPKDKYPINIYLHRMLRDDDGRALHDHPWWFVSIVLSGGYFEVMPREKWKWRYLLKWRQDSIAWRDLVTDLVSKERRPGTMIIRRALSPHRLVLRRPAHLGGESWSIVITGRAKRDWGFYCKTGWRHVREYARLVNNESNISIGCD